MKENCALTLAYNMKVTYFNLFYLFLTFLQSLFIKTFTNFQWNSFEICQKCSSPKNNIITSSHNNVFLSCTWSKFAFCALFKICFEWNLVLMLFPFKPNLIYTLRACCLSFWQSKSVYWIINTAEIRKKATTTMRTWMLTTGKQATKHIIQNIKHQFHFMMEAKQN